MQDPNTNVTVESNANTVRTGSTVRLPEQGATVLLPNNVINPLVSTSANGSPKNTNGNASLETNSHGENVLSSSAQGPSVSFPNQISIPTFVQSRPPGENVFTATQDESLLMFITFFSPATDEF